MHALESHQVSAERWTMLLRRRRCLGSLSVLWLIALLLLLTVGSTVVMLATVVLGVGVVGYLNFLRTQTRRDRERHEHRRSRTSTRHYRSVG